MATEAQVTRHVERERDRIYSQITKDKKAVSQVIELYLAGEAGLELIVDRLADLHMATTDQEKADAVWRLQSELHREISREADEAYPDMSVEEYEDMIQARKAA